MHYIEAHLLVLFIAVDFGERRLTSMKHSYAGTIAYMFEVGLVLLFWQGEPKPKAKPQILSLFKVVKLCNDYV